jgi:hypothetical protein
MKQKTKKQLAREHKKHIATLRRTCPAASRQVEEALFTAAPDYLRFCGQLIIEPREEAIATGKDLSLPREGQFVFFTDGGCHRFPERPPHKQMKLGAGVAHRTRESGEWSVVAFSVHCGRMPYYLEAEMAGIAGALGIALSSISEHGTTLSQKVVVLTDCQSAIFKLKELQDSSRTRAQLQGWVVARKLVTRSQYLGQLGIPVEIRWLPSRHIIVGGNRLAHSGARAAAKGTITVVPEEVSCPDHITTTTTRLSGGKDSFRQPAVRLWQFPFIRTFYGRKLGRY